MRIEIQSVLTISYYTVKYYTSLYYAILYSSVLFNENNRWRMLPMVGRPTFLSVGLEESTLPNGIYSGRGDTDPSSACTGRFRGRGMRTGGGMLLVDVN